MFLVQLIVSSFLDLISKQARRNAVFLFSILKLLQLFRGIDYSPLNVGWLLNRWPLNGGLTVYRVG